MFDSCGLMRIELLDAARPKNLPQPCIHVVGKGSIPGRTRRHATHRRDPAVRSVCALCKAACQASDDGLQRLIVSRVRTPGGQHSGRW